MKKLGARLMVLATLVALTLASNMAYADHKDGCDHGNSNKECREDPQPDRGKDCEPHGKPGVGGGENESHCKEATPDPTPDPTPTVPTDPTPGPNPGPEGGDEPGPGIRGPESGTPRLAETGVASRGLIALGLVLMLTGLGLRRRSAR